jgi:Pentapeptide repeats (8 copies)
VYESYKPLGCEEGADLKGAKLRGTVLEKANLQGADLRCWKPKGDSLQKPQCTDLRDAQLDKANLEKADLRGAENLTVAQLATVKTLYGAKLDRLREEQLRQRYRKRYQELMEKTPRLKGKGISHGTQGYTSRGDLEVTGAEDEACSPVTRLQRFVLSTRSRDRDR